MQRITRLAACRELGGLTASSAGVCAWKRGPTRSNLPAVHRQWAGVCVSPARPFIGVPGAPGRRLCRRKVVFVSQKHRVFSSQPGGDEPPGSSGGQPAVSVVGTPDPITWIRCKVIMYLINLYFELDINSVEFERGVKQALVHVSNLLSSGRYHHLVGIVSNEMIDYVQTRCRSLTEAQRQQLAVTMEDIIFMLPEDVSVVFDQYGRKLCFVVMRFWLLSTCEGPDDPEGTKIFKVASSEDGSPQKKIVTAVYETVNDAHALCGWHGKGAETSRSIPSLKCLKSQLDEFRRELTRGASPDWKVTTIWHWHWKQAE